MEICKAINDKTLTILPVGRLDSASSDSFLEFTQREFTEEFEKVVFDFSNVDYITSKGLRVLLAINKNLGNREMEIIGANADVRGVLNDTGFAVPFGLN